MTLAPNQPRHAETPSGVSSAMGLNSLEEIEHSAAHVKQRDSGPQIDRQRYPIHLEKGFTLSMFVSIKIDITTAYHNAMLSQMPVLME